MMTIGEKIAMLRKEKHITQTELAEYLFLVPQTISKWEVGNGTPEILGQYDQVLVLSEEGTLWQADQVQ